MAKNKKSGRAAGPILPRLPRAEDAALQAMSPDALWQHGEEQEAAFDYEAARIAYREATRRTSGRAGLERLLGLAQFLVERYGQFPEVAGWLDDAEFDPGAHDDATHRALAVLVARAAAEAGHPRLAELDATLAERGEPSSLGRRAETMLQDGRGDAALALLLRHRGRLAPLSPAARLLELLEAQAGQAAEQALQPAVAALQARDLVALDAALAEAQRFASTAAYRGLRARREALADALEAESLRAAIGAALDADDLDAAVTAAQTLGGHRAGTDADRSTLAALQRKVAVRTRDAVLTRAAEAEGEARLRALLDLFAPEIVALGAPALPQVLAAEWTTLQQAAGALEPATLATLLPGVQGLHRLRLAVERGERDAAVALLEAIPLALRELDAPRLARSWQREREQAAQNARLREVVAAARALLAAGEPESAAEALDGSPDHHDPSVRALREAITEQLLRDQQRERLIREVDRAEHGGRLFAARRALAQLEALDDDGAAIAAERGPALLERAAKELRATPIPPFNLALGEGPLAVGFGADRLVLVADRLWLGVNVETRGIAPFQLPEGWPLDATLPCRIGARHGRTRALGSSLGRLVAYEAEPGGRPEIVQARPLGDLLRGEAEILATALEPDADRLALLALPRGEAIPSIVHIDAATFEVESRQRFKPPLRGLCGVANDPEGLLVTTAQAARRKREFALASVDLAGKPLLRFDQQTLSEPLLDIRRAIAWPQEEMLFASYSMFDFFAADRVHQEPSLLVLRQGRIVFASAELRRRFAPNAAITVDHPWALDRETGRLFFAALPRDEQDADASLLGVDARTLRPDLPIALSGVQRVLSIDALPDGAVALCRLRAGGHAIARARRDGANIALTIDKLPV